MYRIVKDTVEAVWLILELGYCLNAKCGLCTSGSLDLVGKHAS